MADNVREETRTSQSSDSIIRVARVVRSVPMVVADCIGRRVHQELENTGPEELNIGKLWRWYHSEQLSLVSGTVIYMHLRTFGMLKRCVGVPEFLAIQEKGTDFFLEHFEKKEALFGWRDIMQVDKRYVYVPFIMEKKGAVVLDWRLLTDDFGPRNPALLLGH